MEEIAEFLAKDTGLDYRDANFLEDADQILALIKQAGYVKLSDDQSLPVPDNKPVFLSKDMKEVYDTAYSIAQDDMLKAGFRRVEL